MSKRKTFAASMIAAAMGLLVYCGSFYLKSYEQNRAAKESYKAVAFLAQASEGELKNAADQEDADTIRESFGISWGDLRAINPQITAWITIPGADISYPIVQGSDDEFYLQHNFEGKEDLFGCIFLGCAHSKDLTDTHSFLYGHNMEGDMMFANLNRYEQPEFLRQCPQIEITTPERKFFYKIFSVEQAAPQSEAFIYGYELSTPAYKQQLEILQKNSMYETGVEADDSQPMVTLITCNSRLDRDIRMAVHAICYRSLEHES